MAKFDESKHPRDKEGKFTFKGGYRQNTKYSEIIENDRRREAVKKYSDDPGRDMAEMGIKPDYLADEYIGKSVGAKVTNYDILMPDGSIVHLAEGTYIQNKEVIAGKGVKRQIDEIEGLVRNYGGKAENWRKMKGVATIDLDGKYEEAEIHWYEEPTIGKVKMKRKDL